MRNEISQREKQQQETPKINETRLAVDSAKQEYRAVFEQNQLLTDKLSKLNTIESFQTLKFKIFFIEHLEVEFKTLTEQNHQRYQTADREHQALQRESSELDCIIVHLRENAGTLWSEINTYRYLLLNLFSPPNEKPQKPSRPHSPVKTHDKIKPPEKFIAPTPEIFKSQETNDFISMVKPIINQVTKATVGTKGKPSPQQYRDETTGFIVHIEDGIIWVRI